MKWLVDSYVWSLALRRQRGQDNLDAEEQHLVAQLAEAIQDGTVAMLGPIRQEILSGVRNAEQLETLRAHLEPFTDERIDFSDYVQAARLDGLCRAVGVKCGPVDMLLCAVAQRNGWKVLTNDASLLRCIEETGRHKKAARSQGPKRNG